MVVVGTSVAGVAACEALRSNGFAGRITLVGAEEQPPYDRPPLSKQFLAGECSPEDIRLRPADQLDRLDLVFRLGVPATGLDPSARTLVLGNGEEIPYGGMIIATGAACRPLPGQLPLDGVFMLRTMADAVALRDRLVAEPRPRVVLIGAGFIGLEVAATARRLGCEVTVLEALAAPLERAVGREVGELVGALHEGAGVKIRCGVKVMALEPSSSQHQVGAVRVAGNSPDHPGSRVGADVVVVSAGVAPNTAWLEASGIELRDGVICDETMQTSLPGVFAAGDCARRTGPVLGVPGGVAEARIEHWTNAVEQGTAAAANLLATAGGGRGTPLVSLPYFWSDQRGHRIQCVGLTTGAEEVRVLEGGPQGAFAALYRHGDRLSAALAVDTPKFVTGCKKLLRAGGSWDEALELAAPSWTLHPVPSS